MYEGDYKDNKKHGQGVYRCADGEVYEGEKLLLLCNKSIKTYRKEIFLLDLMMILDTTYDYC